MDWPFSPPSCSRAFRAAVAGALVAVVITTAFATSPPVVPAEEYVIIVSPDVSETNLSVDRLRRLFLFREKYWKPGKPVKLIYTEAGLEPKSFMLGKIYEMDFPALRRLIVEKLYREEIDLAPKVVASDEVAVAFVASGSGLIALVRAAAIEGSSAKAVAIDGLRPGAAGYALRR